MNRLLRPAAATAVSAMGTRVAARLLDRMPPTLTEPWQRTNFRGEPVTLLEGPAWALGAVLGLLVDPATALPGSIAVLGAAGFGAADDLVGSTASKGLRGHLRALSRGEVTTGAVKIIGLAATGLLAAATCDQQGPRGGDDRVSVVSTLVGGAVIAAGANAINLFDLRPGRALKVTVIAAAGMAASGLSSSRPSPATEVAAASALGAGAAALPDDLAARSMLGDTGANAAGALLGVALVRRYGLLGRSVALAALTGLTLASEKVSFSSVIQRTPWLRAIDQWGRESS